MRKMTLLLSILLMLFILGCGTAESPAPASVPDSTPMEAASEPVITESVEETETFAPAESQEVVPTISADEIPKSPVIDTKYYTISLPDEWKETCFYTVTDDTALTLREQSSYDAFGGGKLCTLLMVPTDDNTYKDFPDYELLCALDTPDGSFYVIALFPTDVQFNEDTIESYNAMAAGLMDVLYTLQPKDGIVMAMT